MMYQMTQLMCVPHKYINNREGYYDFDRNGFVHLTVAFVLNAVVNGR